MRPKILIFICLGALCLKADAQDFITNQNADLVLGRNSFTDNISISPISYSGPTGVAVDPNTGKVFVSDSGKSRVLRYASSSSLGNGAAPEVVIGQPNISSTMANQGNLGANTLFVPKGLYVDSKGTLWVADGNNNRVLGFYLASTLLPSANAVADQVIGQPNFTTNMADVTIKKLNNPTGVFVTNDDTLFVADAFNHRVVGYKNVSTKGNNPDADFVVGQGAFNTKAANLSDHELSIPSGVWVDAQAHLWVSEIGNRRVLRFDNAGGLPTFNATANGVLGQPDFANNGTNLTANGMALPIAVAVDASGSLYVADISYHRVTIYKNAATKANGADADIVIGQSSFTSNAASTTQNSTPEASGLAFDLNGRLFVSNRSMDENRVLRFTKPTLSAPVLPPTVKISGKKKITTSKQSLTIKGIATGSVQRVEVKQGSKTKLAKGTVSWSYKASLKPGKNTFTMRARSSNGLYSAAAKLTVIKK